MKQLLSIIIIALCAAFGSRYLAAPNAAADGNQAITQAFFDRRSDLQVGGSGTVVRILADDNNGDRHQRFVLALDAEHTVLVAHNIDLAPRIDSLRQGDAVEFYGEYEWNEQGGVIHWTHHDPRNQHVGGWLEHRGQRYE